MSTNDLPENSNLIIKELDIPGRTGPLQIGEPRLEPPEPAVAGVVDGVLPADTQDTTLTVVNLNTPTHPALIVDTSPLTLNGFNISIAGSGLTWALNDVDPADTAANRGAQGGVRPYTYTSSHPHFASVDSDGIVRSEGNGTATITVRDAVSQTKQFEVTTRNVRRYTSSKNKYLTYPKYLAWTQTVGGIPIPVYYFSSHLDLLNIKYVRSSSEYERLWWWGEYVASSAGNRETNGLYNFPQTNQWVVESGLDEANNFHGIALLPV